MTTPKDASGASPQVKLLLSAVFLVFLGQVTLSPIIAPLSRQVGLAEWQVGATISLAAVMVVLTSQFWGRRSQSWGRKPVLVGSFGLAAAAMFLFALVSWLGMTGVLSGVALFVLFLLLRGLGFGIAIAAVAPTAQAYIADVTADEEARVKGMAGIGAVQGFAMLGGAVVGGALSAFGLLTPLIAVPLLITGGLVLIVFRLRRQPAHELIEQPPSVSPFDSRVWPFLLAGFGMFTALGFIQVITGFIVQDRFGLDDETTGLVNGGVLLASGLGMIVSQAVIVPRSGWSPSTLMRVGSSTAFVGFLLMLPDGSLPLLVAGMGCIGLGMGLGAPGYTAGPSLLVGREEQGGLAGLIGATNGLTFVIGPTAGTALYGVWGPLPIIVSATSMGLAALFVLLHPRFRSLPKTPVGEVSA